ncbi:amidase [Kutzneria buriramensis]|uniref:Aspartyl-tRNA(Asn)/glutamyl-tRNA(Gln) amidotransferase subunit A n=1 Tax=Kutzneria buriramensis TaxID=1045776 RepID=A0A3E0GW65_9PSEU|nr:amidase [Kutzneria buriramensis]REH30753.1 aspartyl-tRNA(Asn)/glutamyl-tRNA(Gln) amidotransferase subunit A [Kutzneria buriramensis]
MSRSRREWAQPFITAAVDAVRAVDVVPDAAEPWQLGLVDAACAIHDGALTPLELVESCLARIEAAEPAVGAFVSVSEDARSQAASLTGRPVHVLHGVPVGVKDLIDIAGTVTAAGTTVFTEPAAADAPVVSAVKSAGGIVLGKTHTHEIAFGVSTPQSRNPWDPSKMTSGSSGGSAAALAAGFVPAALGTDTGGSLRLPSSFCGTTAIKPTFGLVPIDGVRPLSWSHDVVGPMARDARDAYLLLKVLSGSSIGDPLLTLGRLPSAAGLRVGVPDDSFLAAARPEVVSAMDGVADVLADLGAGIVPVRLPDPGAFGAASSVMIFREAAEIYRPHVDGEPFSHDVQAFLEAGQDADAADYVMAQRVRRRLIQQVTEVLGAVDLLLMPSSPVPDLPHGTDSVDGVPLIPVLTPFMFPASLTGLPAIAFPAGATDAGMPIGAQLVGPAHGEALLTGAAAAYQSVTPWHLRRPPL